MGTLPNKLLLARRDIVGETGVTDYMFRKMVATGALRALRIRGMRQTRYLRAEVVKLFGIKEGG